MPKTKFQSVIFTALMAFCMVYCMTVYTITLNYGALSYQIFSMALCLQIFFVGPLVRLIFRNIFKNQM